MYDNFSLDYDRFVNWSSRLEHELPFIVKMLKSVDRGSPIRILDAACGTGMHTIALAERGYVVAGADLSQGMIERARINAAAAGHDILFATAGFGSLASIFESEEKFPFDALFCLGNSLPHVSDSRELASALRDFAACLRPGGILLIQNRNFDAVLVRQERWMDPQSHREGDLEWLFLRFYDFKDDGTLDFNVIRLRREGEGRWMQGITTTSLYPIQKNELETESSNAGFDELIFFGDMEGSPFDRETSGNLVMVAMLGVG